MALGTPRKSAEPRSSCRPAKGQARSTVMARTNLRTGYSIVRSRLAQSRARRPRFGAHSNELLCCERQGLVQLRRQQQRALRQVSADHSGAGHFHAAQNLAGADELVQRAKTVVETVRCTLQSRASSERASSCPVPKCPRGPTCSRVSLAVQGAPSASLVRPRSLGKTLDDYQLEASDVQRATTASRVGKSARCVLEGDGALTCCIQLTGCMSRHLIPWLMTHLYPADRSQNVNAKSGMRQANVPSKSKAVSPESVRHPSTNSGKQPTVLRVAPAATVLVIFVDPCRTVRVWLSTCLEERE
jgi:hypothetical protein